MTDAARSLEWVRDKCCSGLGVEPELFDELLQTGGSDAIVQFLQGGASPGPCMCSGLMQA